MSIRQEQDLVHHPHLGASWEGFALEQVLSHLQLREEEAFFWALHSGGELDLLFQAKGKLWGVEFKYTDAPTIGRSMRSALQELDLAHMWVIYPGEETYPLDHSIIVAGLNNLEKTFESVAAPH